MKSLIVLLFLNLTLLTINSCLPLGTIFAQWQPDVRLTNDPAASNTSNNNAWCIASIGNTVHVVWYDQRDGNREIYYKRSTDGGVSWGADTRLTNNTAASNSPSVTVSGLFVHVVWYDNRDFQWQIYYKRSTDGGVSWGADTQLSDALSGAIYPSVSVSGQDVHVVWEDSYEIYYKRSTDAGVSWGAVTRLTITADNSTIPSGAVSGQFVHVVWEDNRDGNYEIYYKRSTDGGVSWATDTRLTNNAFNSNFPSGAVSGQIVHVVWHDFRDANWEIYYKRSTDGGVNWGADARLTNNSALSYNAFVAVSAQVVYVVWHDFRDANWEIYYKRSTDGGVNWGADARLTINSSSSVYPSAAVSDPVMHVVWTDNRDGNGEIYYKRDPTGSVVGINPIRSEIPKEFSLSQNYPNPFNPSTFIKFQVASYRFVKLNVFDVLGRDVATLVNEQLQPGTYEVEFDGTNYPSGVYFYNMISGDISITKKMILIK